MSAITVRQALTKALAVIQEQRETQLLAQRNQQVTIPVVTNTSKSIVAEQHHQEGSSMTADDSNSYGYSQLLSEEEAGSEYTLNNDESELSGEEDGGSYYTSSCTSSLSYP